MESHWTVKLQKLNIAFKYKKSLYERDNRSYVEHLQFELNHIMALRDLMRSLPWEDQIEFCRISGHSDSLFIWLDKEQRIAYRIIQ